MESYNKAYYQKNKDKIKAQISKKRLVTYVIEWYHIRIFKSIRRVKYVQIIELQMI